MPLTRLDEETHRTLSVLAAAPGIEDRPDLVAYIAALPLPDAHASLLRAPLSDDLLHQTLEAIVPARPGKFPWESTHALLNKNLTPATQRLLAARMGERLSRLSPVIDDTQALNIIIKRALSSRPPVKIVDSRSKTLLSAEALAFLIEHSEHVESRQGLVDAGILPLAQAWLEPRIGPAMRARAATSGTQLSVSAENVDEYTHHVLDIVARLAATHPREFLAVHHETPGFGVAVFERMSVNINWPVEMQSEFVRTLIDAVSAGATRTAFSLFAVARSARHLDTEVRELLGLTFTTWDGLPHSSRPAPLAGMPEKYFVEAHQALLRVHQAAVAIHDNMSPAELAAAIRAAGNVHETRSALLAQLEAFKLSAKELFEIVESAGVWEEALSLRPDDIDFHLALLLSEPQRAATWFAARAAAVGEEQAATEVAQVAGWLAAADVPVRIAFALGTTAPRHRLDLLRGSITGSEALAGAVIGKLPAPLVMQWAVENGGAFRVAAAAALLNVVDGENSLATLTATLKVMSRAEKFSFTDLLEATTATAMT